MGFDVRITGGRDLHSVSRKLKELGGKGLGKQMAKGLQDASKPLRPAIKASAATLLPQSGGHAAVMARSLKFRQTTQATRTTARVVFRVHADGRREKRDVPSVNRGRLRKPLYGNRGFWYDQRVRPGFVDRPVDKLGPEIKRQMDSVVDYIADQIGAT